MLDTYVPVTVADTAVAVCCEAMVPVHVAPRKDSQSQGMLPRESRRKQLTSSATSNVRISIRGTDGLRTTARSRIDSCEGRTGIVIRWTIACSFKQLMIASLLICGYYRVISK